MQMNQDGVQIYCLPDSAKCSIDDKERNPLDMDICPMGYTECTGNCIYYTE